MRKTDQSMRLVAGNPPVAGVVEIHEMAMDNGVMKMRQIPGIEILRANARPQAGQLSRDVAGPSKFAGEENWRHRPHHAGSSASTAKSTMEIKAGQLAAINANRAPRHCRRQPDR